MQLAAQVLVTVPLDLALGAVLRRSFIVFVTGENLFPKFVSSLPAFEGRLVQVGRHEHHLAKTVRASRHERQIPGPRTFMGFDHSAHIPQPRREQPARLAIGLGSERQRLAGLGIIFPSGRLP